MGTPTQSNRDALTTTAAAVIYGIGQALGPFLAGVLSRATGDPDDAVLAASVAVGVGGALLADRSRWKRATAVFNP